MSLTLESGTAINLNNDVKIKFNNVNGVELSNLRYDSTNNKLMIGSNKVVTQQDLQNLDVGVDFANLTEIDTFNLKNSLGIEDIRQTAQTANDKVIPVEWKANINYGKLVHIPQGQYAVSKTDYDSANSIVNSRLSVIEAQLGITPS